MGSAEERAGVLHQDEFEDLARHAMRANEALRLEYVAGKLRVKAVSDGVRGRIIVWLIQVVARMKPGFWLFQDQGLRVESYRRGSARPDGAVAPLDTFVSQGEWAGTEDVQMVVEITSRDSDTNRRDRVEKPRAYAQSRIPVYLLIDRDTREVRVHSEPDGVRYEQVATVPFGKSVTLPEPVGFELETGQLPEWVQ